MSWPALNGSWPDVYTRLPVRMAGTYAPTGLGGGGSSMPRADSRDSGFIAGPSAAGVGKLVRIARLAQFLRRGGKFVVRFGRRRVGFRGAGRLAGSIGVRGLRRLRRRR